MLIFGLCVGFAASMVVNIIVLCVLSDYKKDLAVYKKNEAWLDVENAELRNALSAFCKVEDE